MKFLYCGHILVINFEAADRKKKKARGTGNMKGWKVQEKRYQKYITLILDY